MDCRCDPHCLTFYCCRSLGGGLSVNPGQRDIVSFACFAAPRTTFALRACAITLDFQFSATPATGECFLLAHAVLSFGHGLPGSTGGCYFPSLAIKINKSEATKVVPSDPILLLPYCGNALNARRLDHGTAERKKFGKRAAKQNRRGTSHLRLDSWSR